MLAVRYEKNIPRWLATRFLGRRWPALYTGPTSCIRLAEVEEPALPGPRWVKIATRLSGICGSDLATITAKGTPYFSPFTSSPFVLGHENVGVIVETGPEVEGWRVGQRVAVMPSLCCAVREVEECRSCAAGQFGACERVTAGKLAPGVQTGYCKDTGGGWSPRFVAHAAQLHPLPDALPDEAAVLLEPLACAVHAALLGKDAPRESRSPFGKGGRLRKDEGGRMKDEGPGVRRIHPSSFILHPSSALHPSSFILHPSLVLGCGTMGLLTVAALRRLFPECRIAAVARYPHQERLARALGADEVWGRGTDLYAETCRFTGGRLLRPEIGKPVVMEGFDRVFDCVGSGATVDDSLRLCRTRGTVVLVGMPAVLRGLDGTALWHKEIRLQGAYTYGTEEYGGERLSTFALAERLLLAEPGRFAELVGARYPLREYRAAVESALHTGRSGAAKTVFAFDS
jgi:threonine dehydrogenase-like Zn-dependent dehydrogenase